MAKNFRCKGGELDLIAKKGDLLVFIEVKARKTSNFGYSAEFVNGVKRKRILNCAKYFIQKNRLDNLDIRFDVIGFDGENLEWIENIFMEEV